jgi:hypothetical protein
MNALTTLPPGGIPSVFASRTNLPDMAAAAQANLLPSFAVISYKGRNWRIKYRGEDELLMDDRGVPMATLEVAIVGISPAISKIWYDKRYSEGDNAAPDCWSTNGVAPDPASPKKQCASCAACPQNVFGSRITEAGKKGKACQDARRVAVVPVGDIENETYGGPMLLRIPPMSLGNLAKYTSDIARFNAQPYMVGTVLGFNYDVAYPEITFKTLGWLSNEDAAGVLNWISDPQVERILSTEIVEVSHDPGDTTAGALAGGPPAAFGGGAQPAVAPQPAPQPAPAPAPAAVAPQPAPVQQAAPAAPPAKKTGGFGKKSSQSAPAAAAQPAAQPTVVQGAPANMDAAIDDLLS